MFRPLLLFLATAASGQTLVEGVAATAPGRWGLEAGVTVAAGGGLDVSGPEVLLLWGAVPGVEARLALPDLVGLDVRGDGVRGLGDAAVGVKAETGTAAGWQTAVLAELTVPTGSAGISGGAVSPLVLASAARAVGGLDVGVQVEGLWDRAAGRVEAGAVGLGAVSWRAWGLFAEAAVATAPGGASVVAHGGALWLVRPSLQVDVRLGGGLTDAAPGVFGGVGLRAALN